MTEPRPGRYAEQARTYDLTRGASPTLVRLLSRFLGPSLGRSLVDLCGGTGNYARAMASRGFKVSILDVQPAMVARSVGKLGRGRQMVGDALHLPFRDHAFDCAMMVAVLHLIADRTRAFKEARRIIREGPYVLQAFTEENLRHAFIFEYFPGAGSMEGLHPPAAVVESELREAGFSSLDRETYIYLDTADANLHALHTDPLRLAGPAYLRNTSFFQRLPEDVRREGLEALARDLRAGVLAEKVKASFQEAMASGHGTIIAARP